MNTNLVTAKVYKIYCPSNPNDIVYYGSTIKPIKTRFTEHIRNYMHYKQSIRDLVYNLPKYCSSYEVFQTFGIENCRIQICEHQLCPNRNHIRQLESLYIFRNKSCNTNLPCCNPHYTPIDIQSVPETILVTHNTAVQNDISFIEQQDTYVQQVVKRCEKQSFEDKIKSKVDAVENDPFYTEFVLNNQDTSDDEMKKYIELYKSKHKDLLETTKQTTQKDLEQLKNMTNKYQNIIDSKLSVSKYRREKRRQKQQEKYQLQQEMIRKQHELQQKMLQKQQELQIREKEENDRIEASVQRDILEHDLDENLANVLRALLKENAKKKFKSELDKDDVKDI